MKIVFSFIELRIEKSKIIIEWLLAHLSDKTYDRTYHETYDKIKRMIETYDESV
jgi:hypothetical protein